MEIIAMELSSFVSLNQSYSFFFHLSQTYINDSWHTCVQIYIGYPNIQGLLELSFVSRAQDAK